MSIFAITIQTVLLVCKNFQMLHVSSESFCTRHAAKVHLAPSHQPPHLLTNSCISFIFPFASRSGPLRPSLIAACSVQMTQCDIANAEKREIPKRKTYLPLSLSAKTSKKPSPERMYCSLIAPNSS